MERDFVTRTLELLGVNCAKPLLSVRARRCCVALKIADAVALTVTARFAVVTCASAGKEKVPALRIKASLPLPPLKEREGGLALLTVKVSSPPPLLNSIASALVKGKEALAAVLV